MEKKIKHTFPRCGIVNQSHNAIFIKIENLGIHILENLKYFPYKIAYDFETLFKDCEKEDTSKLTNEKYLVPASGSVCPDIPGFTEPRCVLSERNLKDMIIIKCMTIC